MIKRNNIKMTLIYRASTQTWSSFLISVVTLSAVFLLAISYVFLALVLLYYYVFSLPFWIVVITLVTTLWWHHIVLNRGWWNLTHWRENRIFEAWRSYFDLHIYSDEDEPKIEKNTIYAFVPHGLFPFALALISGIMFKKEKNLKIAVASSLFYLPVFSFILRMLGCIEANKDMFKTKQQNILVIVPDGIAGAFYSDRKHERLYLKKRNEFIKQAILHGYDIVPVYCFGHTQLYDVYGWQELSRRLRFMLVLFSGRSPAIWLPHARTVSVVFGPRIHINQIEDVTKEQVDWVHGVFIDAIVNLYKKYKLVVPDWDKEKELEIH